MKQTIFIAIILLCTSSLYAQKDNEFYKNEIKASVGDALLAVPFWTHDWSNSKNSANLYANLSFSYLYRPVKWFWVGGNFVNYFGDIIHYDWREYNIDGSFRDFSKSKMKYCAVIAPETRFSYLNRDRTVLYSAFSAGVGLKNGYDSKWQKYPQTIWYFHITCFGFSINFGTDDNIFLGGELGLGFKGFFNIHGGYRF